MLPAGKALANLAFRASLSEISIWYSITQLEFWLPQIVWLTDCNLNQWQSIADTLDLNSYIKHTCLQDQFLPLPHLHYCRQDQRAMKGSQGQDCRATPGWNGYKTISKKLGEKVTAVLGIIQGCKKWPPIALSLQLHERFCITIRDKTIQEGLINDLKAVRTTVPKNAMFGGR